jgi:glutathione S-transferase
MKLYHSPLSPFVRKVLVAAHELGLANRIEWVPISTTPMAPDPKLKAANPLNKIPALVTDDNDTLYDSGVILEYLDALAGGGKILPAAGPARWRAKRQEALAGGMGDAAVLVRYETALRPEPLRWADWVAGQRMKVDQALDTFEIEAWLFEPAPNVGTIALGCMLGWMEFRFGTDWRKGRDTLARWYDGFAQRPSMLATKPQA